MLLHNFLYNFLHTPQTEFKKQKGLALGQEELDNKCDSLSHILRNALGRIRNKEFERIEVDTSLLRKINPLKGINEEIYNYANLKQLEIDELKRLEAFRRDFLQDENHINSTEKTKISEPFFKEDYISVESLG